MMELSIDQYEAAFRTNMLGPLLLNRKLARRMMEGDGGSIINVLSGSGFLPNPFLAAYGSTKAGLWMQTRYQAKRVGPQRRANALCPGVVIDHGRADQRSSRVDGQTGSSWSSWTTRGSGWGRGLSRVRRRELQPPAR